MSNGKRAYNLLRGYVNREWDRIKDWERKNALTELNTPSPASPSGSVKQPETENTVIYVPEGTTKEEAAREVLGVEKDAGFREIRHAFVKLSRRSDPTNFDSSTEEHRQALDIHKKVHWAYKILTDDMSASEKRFGSLEID